MSAEPFISDPTVDSYGRKLSPAEIAEIEQIQAECRWLDEALEDEEAGRPIRRELRVVAAVPGPPPLPRCKRGHELAGDNLRVRANGRRRCMTCVPESPRIGRKTSAVYERPLGRGHGQMLICKRSHRIEGGNVLIVTYKGRSYRRCKACHDMRRHGERTNYRKTTSAVFADPGKRGRGAMLVCKRGHEFSGENVRIKPNGNRQCLPCERITDKARKGRRS